MELGKKMSYVMGLIDGLEIDRQTKEGKVLIELSEILKAVVEEIETLNTKVDDITELAEDIDYDLGELEEVVFGLTEDDDCHCCGDEDEEISNDFLERLLKDDDDNIRDVSYEIECPKCKKEILLSKEQIEKGSINCPKCAELLEFDIDEDDEE
ncbi:MAG: hypothetical protein LBM93_03040 [Oscillospiraceae bacterium]|jgi:Zn finger protein HypA/HybF involved in hydrogenase expression|nr:hypothetical protein [Oscillospiraceae bacterium]